MVGTVQTQKKSAKNTKDAKPDEEENADSKPLRELGVLHASSTPRRSTLREVQAANLPVEVIDPNPWQPRRDFPAEEIHDFAERIAVETQLQPIAVRLAPGRTDAYPRYEVADGERRLARSRFWAGRRSAPRSANTPTPRCG